MPQNFAQDESNGYEEVAEAFMSRRNPQIGAAAVRQWGDSLPRGSSVLDLGCGHGVPVSQVLIEQGFRVYGVDASPKMIAAFRGRFPLAHAECAAVEDSKFFGRTFDGVIAWGLIFLLPTAVQPKIVRRVAKALNRGGKFLFTSPEENVTWQDSLTGRHSISLGAAKYQRILLSEGLVLDGERSDEGDNHYYLASKP
ncbi:MAG TPA: class I SAM-dependent methyltransferase [Candidatus Dormibacteraeota bacterium]|nr:class I SAM-dependent methyltransferase [Candidatus Dormibacteraeota bacterium]